MRLSFPVKTLAAANNTYNATLFDKQLELFSFYYTPEPNVLIESCLIDDNGGKSRGICGKIDKFTNINTIVYMVDYHNGVQSIPNHHLSTDSIIYVLTLYRSILRSVKSNLMLVYFTA